MVFNFKRFCSISIPLYINVSVDFGVSGAHAQKTEQNDEER